MLDSKLLTILVCPLCKAHLELNRNKQELTCKKCKLAYPIEDNIPIMLVDRARDLNNE